MSRLERFSENTILESLGFGLKKRTIAVVVADNEMSLSQHNLNDVVKAVKEGIIANQFNAVTFHLSTLCDDLTCGTYANKFVLPMRDSVSNTVECYGSIDDIDGFVFVANQPTVIAGMLFGAIRSNKPCLFVSGGYMPTACVNNTKYGFNSSYEFVGASNTGQMSAEDLENMKSQLITCFGNASDSYAANSASILVESVGLALQGNSTYPAYSNQRILLARKTGERITTMVEKIITPQLFINDESLATALAVDLSFGSSSVSFLNMLALLRINKNKNPLQYIVEMSKQIPRLVDISSSSGIFMEDFAEAGGVYALLTQLRKLGHTTLKHTAYNGKQVGEVIKGCQLSEGKGISFTNTKPRGLTFLNGNIAETGAISFLNEVPVFTGKAKVFDCEESAFDAILCREIKKGDVLVIINEGPKSGPGMREIRLPIALLKGMDLDRDVAVITDGRVENISRGIVVGCVTPETCQNGNIQLIQNNDTIEINLQKGKVTVDVSSKDLNKREKSYVCKKVEASSYLNKFANSARSAMEGVTVAK